MSNPITSVIQQQSNQTQTSTDNSSKWSYSDSSSFNLQQDNKVDNSKKWSYSDARNYNLQQDNRVDNSVDNSYRSYYSDSSSYNFQQDNSVKNTYTDNTNNSVNNTYTDNRAYTDNSRVDNSVDNSFTYTDNSTNDNSITDNSDNSVKNYSFGDVNGPVFFQSSINGGVGNTQISGGVGNTYVDNSKNTYTDNSVTNIDNSVKNVTDNSITDNSVNNIDNSVTDNSTNVVSQGPAFVYSGGDQVIADYKEGDKIKLASDYKGIGLNGNSFFVNSSSGSLEIQNSRDKFIEYTGEDENTVAYTYVASGAGDIDGRGKAEAEIMIGGDNADNQMFAGSGNSSLWGGNGGNDVLIGGEGYTEFVYAVGSGNDVVQNSTSNDMVNLLGVSLEQIANVNVNIGEVNLNFTDGGSLRIEGNTGVGYKLGDQVYTVNQSTGEWSTKE